MKQLDSCLEFSVRRFHVETLACLECKIYTYTYIFHMYTLEKVLWPCWEGAIFDTCECCEDFDRATTRQSVLFRQQ